MKPKGKLCEGYLFLLLCKCRSGWMEPSPGASNDYSLAWWVAAHNRKYLQSSWDSGISSDVLN